MNLCSPPRIRKPIRNLLSIQTRLLLKILDILDSRIRMPFMRSEPIPQNLDRFGRKAITDFWRSRRCLQNARGDSFSLCSILKVCKVDEKITGWICLLCHVGVDGIWRSWGYDEFTAKSRTCSK